MKCKRRWLTILTVLFYGMTICSVILIWREVSGRQKDIDNFVLLEKTVSLSTQSKNNTDTGQAKGLSDLIEAVTEEEGQVQDKHNLKALYLQNDECVGWISITDTNVNYPVMHTPSEPEKYLRKNFYSEYSVSGVPFIDAKCSLDKDHLILYGHNMKNGTMFANLRYYTDYDYYLTHPDIGFETLSESGSYKIFAVAIVKEYDEWYSFFDVSSPEGYDEKINYIKQKALYSTKVTPQSGQQVITLSTCYGKNAEDRLVVVAAKETL